MNPEQITLVVGLGIVVLGAIVWVFKKPERAAQNTIKIPGGFEFTMNTPAIATMAIGVVLVVVSRTLPTLPDSPKPVPPDVPAGELDPAPAPPSDKRVNAFVITFNQSDKSAWREWKRATPDRWIETYPSGNEEVFDVVGHFALGDCPGTVVKSQNDKNHRVFIPDKGCPGMPFHFSNDNKNWLFASPMTDVN